MRIVVDKDWWKTLFDDVYLLTDSRSVCDGEITAKEIGLVRELLPLERHHLVLDLCGGHGRHSLELARRGFAGLTVFDYSERLLQIGRESAEREGREIFFVQGDARATGFDADSFDHVLVMGNSLGYIHEDSADADILMEAWRVLRPGGHVLLDVTDGAATRERFSPNAWHELEDGVVVCRERELNKDYIHAREMVICKEKGLIRDKTYCVRLHDRDSLAALAKDAGFEDIAVHAGLGFHGREGDYGFMNHRMILTARKPGTPG